MKTCLQCLEEKPLTEFYKKLDSKTGLRAQCKKCVDARNKHRYDTILKLDPAFVARNRARGMDWYNKNKERNSARTKKRHKELRQICLDHYGPNCACCGESTYEFLSIDHTNGGGTQHRKAGISKICRWLVSNKFPEGFRVLCHNCNQAYGFHGRCPHQLLKQKASDIQA